MSCRFKGSFTSSSNTSNRESSISNKLESEPSEDEDIIMFLTLQAKLKEKDKIIMKLKKDNNSKQKTINRGDAKKISEKVRKVEAEKTIELLE